MKLKIKRKRWLRGVGSDDAYLYRSEDRKMCCLGFYARALGYPVNKIRDIQDPENCDDKEDMDSLLNEYGYNNSICQNLIHVNDSPSFGDSDREVQIKKLFKKIGVDVTFVG
jgi:hypothetical protein